MAEVYNFSVPVGRGHEQKVVYIVDGNQKAGLASCPKNKHFQIVPKSDLGRLEEDVQSRGLKSLEVSQEYALPILAEIKKGRESAALDIKVSQLLAELGI